MYGICLPTFSWCLWDKISRQKKTNVLWILLGFTKGPGMVYQIFSRFLRFCRQKRRVHSVFTVRRAQDPDADVRSDDDSEFGIVVFKDSVTRWAPTSYNPSLPKSSSHTLGLEVWKEPLKAEPQEVFRGPNDIFSGGVWMSRVSGDIPTWSLTASLPLESYKIPKGK